jgi:hypothetical protein
LLALFMKSSPRQPVWWVFTLALLLSIPHLTKATPVLFYSRLQSFGQYVAQAIAGDPIDPRQNAAYDPYRFPQAWLERIDGGTVDAIPIDIALVYINHLAYNPRPMIQSLTAYDEYLDRINFKKYASNTAPDYLLFSVGGAGDRLDERHPFFAETKTKIAIISRFQQAEKTDRLLLLERQPTIAKCEARLVAEGQSRLGKHIPLPTTGNILVIKPQIEYNLAGKLMRFFYQPPILKTVQRFKGGEIKRFRAILPMVSNGVIANRLVDDLATAEEFLETYGEGGREVRSISFETRDSWGFKKQYPYQIFEVSIDPTIRRDDTTELEACVAVISGAAVR